MDTPHPAQQQIEAQILAMTSERGFERSICPSEVARALRPEWHSLMTSVRAAAAKLAQDGRIDILRKGKPVDPAGFKGVIRLRAKASG